MLAVGNPTRRTRLFDGLKIWGLAFLLLGFALVGAALSGEETSSATVARPERVVLVGPDAVQQLVVETKGERDLTAGATFESLDPSVATVDAAGLVSAVSGGEAAILIKVGDAEIRVPVVVESFSPGPPIHFTNDVVPIFTKLGCNSGGCHGKSSGQNGFRLSLLGFEPELDYETLVREGRGRRLFPAAPEHSLLLTKAVAQVPHGGGKKMEADSHEYRVIRRWVASGMPRGASDAAAVARIEVYPDGRTLTEGQTQQVQVTAVYSDGTRQDVTRWTQFESNDLEVAEVDEIGRVRAGGLSGQAAIMARYQGQVTVFRATVPLEGRAGQAIAAEFKPANFIDENVLAQWRKLGIEPSVACTDEEFLRRASLDITGTLPTAQEVERFVADTNPDKRERLVEDLLERPAYAAYFATRWADILRNKREGNAALQAGTFRFYDWIRDALASNMPFDDFAASILAASGTPESAPAVVWYRSLRSPDAFVDDTAQVFLGMRLQCAKCHHHPFEQWSENDYYGFAAFFGRVGRKPATLSQRAGRDRDEAIFNARSGEVKHPKTGQVMSPKGLGAEVLTVSASEDPRRKLVDWMADPANPYFARALVNRYWAHFLSRGIVEPMDDMRLTNPPSNPELLDALASHFVRSGYDLKELVRTICTSRVYGLSSLPNETNARDKQSFARNYPKRMQAEVLLDSIARLSGAPVVFGGLPAGTRAIELPDESVGSTFLDSFGRPKRDSACECERVSDASLGQSLMLLNSKEIQGMLAAAGARAEAMAKDERPDAEKLDEIFLTAFARKPSSSERAAAIEHLERKAENKKEAYEDILWALVNAKEFQFND